MVVGFIKINTLIQITNICLRVAAGFAPPPLILLQRILSPKSSQHSLSRREQKISLFLERPINDRAEIHNLNLTEPL